MALEIGAFTVLTGIIGSIASDGRRKFFSAFFIFMVSSSLLFKFALLCYTPVFGDIYVAKNRAYTYYLPHSSSILSTFIIIDIAAIILTVILVNDKQDRQDSYELT